METMTAEATIIKKELVSQINMLISNGQKNIIEQRKIVTEADETMKQKETEHLSYLEGELIAYEVCKGLITKTI